MQTLFTVESFYPHGFSYEENFITEAEETDLLHRIEQTALHTFNFQGYEAKRKVASFGWDWSFDKRVLTKGKDIPLDYRWLIERAATKLGLAPAAFAELLITEYPVGSVINWHRDAPPFGIIAGISLASDCTFKLRPHEKEKQSKRATVAVPVKQRSLYVLQGEAREAWQHSTLPVQERRYSITLRTLKAGVRWILVKAVDIERRLRNVVA